ncbi:uracil-DNA glycosylase [Megasphaera sp. DJF_B143]|uniref:uracil-DNA glycosylase n=1 Tax=Megasphaera sp. DJF_B143 TaxID=537288 RepID=UPI00073E2CE2|nr:uracil-DNA glycosylase [Megasphaera sp. DJF_B143]KUH56379.1 hypothetical protein AT798_03325 [Megasphaera sp. DJF_B143]
MTIEDFIHSLQTYTSPAVCNPWRDYDRTCDLGPQAPEIRRHQLQEYLAQRIGQARYLFVAEAAGYQGCRFTGIAITCERMLLGAHKQVTSAMVLGHTGQRTSRPDSPYMTSRPQREQGMNEPTDTYVWGAILDNGLNPRDVLLWNIFPFHPHKDSPFSNRTPTDEELSAGLAYTRQLLALCQQPLRIGAIGRKAAETLQAAGIPAVATRHPANGGAGLFRKQFSDLIKTV